MNLQKYDQALTYYQKAIELNPNDADVYANLGFIYLSLSQRQKALENFLKARELHKNAGNNQAVQQIEQILNKM